MSLTQHWAIVLRAPVSDNYVLLKLKKYPHVTFFFNGGRDDPLHGEDRLLVDSPKVATYDLQPQMSAAQVAAGISDALVAKTTWLDYCEFWPTVIWLAIPVCAMR